MPGSSHHRICQEHNNYPNNIQGTEGRPCSASFIISLGDAAQRLFSRSQASVSTITRRSRECTLYRTATNLNMMKGDLNGDCKVPELRYVCIRSDYSTRSFRCSIEMFTYLMSFYMVPPIILDFVMSFSRSGVAINRHLSAFHVEKNQSTQIWSNQDTRFLDRIIRHFYEFRFLRKVRRHSDPWEPYTWEVQHLIVYHYFDPSLEKSHWITIMSDDLASDADLPKLGKAGTVLNCFNIWETSLSMHIDLYKRCDQAWQNFVTEFHDELHRLKTKAQDIRFSSHIDEDVFSHSDDLGILMEPIGTSSEERRSIQRQPTSYENLSRAYSSASAGTTPLIREDTSPNGDFDLCDIQKLSRIKDRLAEASLAVKLNQTVLADLCRAYKSISLEFPEQKTCLDDFISQIESLQGSARYCEAQLHDLISLRKDVKNLIDDIREFQDLNIRKTFAAMSQASEHRMERLASEANQQTASMYIITVITLIFLPSTFVTTFMQSGVFQWAEEELQGRSYVFRGKIFFLFLVICIVSTFLTLGLWVAMLRYRDRIVRLIRA